MQFQTIPITNTYYFINLQFTHILTRCHWKKTLNLEI